MINPNIEEKLEVVVKRLSEYRVTDEIPLEVFYTDGTGERHRLPEVGEKWKKFERPYVLFEEEKYYWFRCKFSVEKPAKGKRTYLSINTFIQASATIRPQGLLYLNGKAVQGIDVNHTDVLLTDGEYEMYLLFYTHTFGRILPLYFSLKTVDESISSMYYDLCVPLEGIKLLLKNTDEYRDTVTVLEKAVNKIDFRQICSEEFYASLEEAKEYLYRNFYHKLCGSDKTVDCIAHTHIDVAWLWDLDQTRQKSERSFSTVLKLMEEYPEYRFMSSQPQLFDYLKRDNPELFDRIKQKVKEGRWEMDGAMWLEADCNLTSGESLVRQIYYGKKFFKEEFDEDCTCVWLPDVFGYSAALPQIMQKSGIRRFVTAKIGWNDTNRFPYDAFIWQGIDGSCVFAYLLSACCPDPRKGVYDTDFTSYCPELDPQSVLGSWNRFGQKEFTKTIMMSYGHGDGGGGPTAEMIERERRMEYGLPGFPRTRIVPLRKALDEIEDNFNKSAEELKRRPKWNGELYFEYHRGTLTSVPKNKMKNRRGEFALLNAEFFKTAEGKLLHSRYPFEMLEKDWKLLLLNQFHDIIPGSSIKKVYDDSERQYAEIFSDCEKMIGQALDGITDRISSNGGTVVFNPNSFIADGTVIVDGKTKIAREIPAYGYKVVSFSDSENNVEIGERTIENVFYRIVFDDSGAIVSLFDKRNSREIVSFGEKLNEMRSYENMPYEYDNWELTPYHKQKEYLLGKKAAFRKVADGDRAGFEIVKNYYDSAIVQKVFIYSDTIDRIDFITSVAWKEKRQVLKARFPFDMLVNEATYDIQFGNIKRSTSSNTSWEAARFECAAHKWVDMSENNYGVALLNDGKYGFGAEDNVLTLTITKSGGYPYEGASDDIPVFTYSLVPHKGRYDAGKAAEKAYVLNRPFICRRIKKNEGSLPDEYSFASSETAGIFIETVKSSENGDGVVLRLYEGYGERKEANIKLGFDFEKAYLCDLSENRIGEAEVKYPNIKLDVKPFEIITIEVV